MALEILTLDFAIVVLAAACLASIAVWSRRGPWPKFAAVTLSGVLMGTGYVGLSELLGKPKPAFLEFSESALRDAKVISTQVIEGETVFLWLQMDQERAPRAYAMPWEDQRVRELFRALEKAKKDGSEVRVRGSLSGVARYDDTLFYVVPQQALPPKEYETHDEDETPRIIPQPRPNLPARPVPGPVQEPPETGTGI